MGREGQRTKSAIRNQARIAVSGSLLPSWEKARMRVRRAQARLCGRDARAPRPQTYPCKGAAGELGGGAAGLARESRTRRRSNSVDGAFAVVYDLAL